MLDPRDLATIRAALAYWQRMQAAHIVSFYDNQPKGPRSVPEDDIASNNGEFDPLRGQEITALAMRFAEKPANFHVEVYMLGGDLKKVKMPRGVSLEVYDYYVEGLDADELDKDPKGRPCVKEVFTKSEVLVKHAPREKPSKVA